MTSSIYQVVTSQQEELLKRLKSLSYPKKLAPPHTLIPFGEIFEVWSCFALKEVQKTHSLSFLCPAAVDAINMKLIHALSYHSAPTLGAMLRLAKLDGLLEGDTPKQRYLYFVEEVLPAPQYLTELFASFPPLASKIASLILLWIDDLKEFASRFETDRLALARDLFAKGNIAHLTHSLSDFHKGNRSVYKLKFENGVEIFYKPKPLDLDVGFNRLLERLNEWDLPFHFKTCRILDRGSYGWSELIETLPCEQKEQIKRYFERLGGLICLMYVLEGSDCHLENLIASGEHPVLIDLETLLSSQVKPSLLPFENNYSQTVYRTGFLPFLRQKSQPHHDSSPLTAEERPSEEIPLVVWKEVNTDMMEFHVVKKALKRTIPRPRFEGKIVSIAPYMDDLVSGFETIYRCLATNKDLVVHELDNLTSHKVRYVFRGTRLYIEILRRLTDPQLMQSEEEIDEALQVLFHGSLNNDALMQKIVQQEKEALLHADIPYFTSSSFHTHLYSGDQCIEEDFFEMPVREKVRANLHRLGEEDLKDQKEFIYNSLHFSKEQPRIIPTYKPYVQDDSVPHFSDQEKLDLAEQIGNKILSRSRGHLSWLDLELDLATLRHEFRPMSLHLYSGVLGIALFFAALGSFTQKPTFLQSAEELLEKIRKALRERQESLLRHSLGGMEGIGGAIYGFTAIGKILKKESLLEEAAHFSSWIDQEKIKTDRNYDLLTGSAGLILALLSLYRETRSQPLLELGEIAGKHLICQATSMEKGLGWIAASHLLAEPKNATQVCLCGLSHGVAGIALALMRLYQFSCNPLYLETAKAGFLYERSHYSQTEQNWPDFRFTADPPNYAIKNWCHGAPGIGFSRLYSLFSAADPKIQDDLEQALSSTISHLYGQIDQLCCGDFGRIAFLHDAGTLCGREEIVRIAERGLDRHLKRYKENKEFRIFNGPNNVQSPSFMQGLSGIGYAILRQTKAGRSLPQPLVLD